jgi:autotransporter-associated beta strand protein
MGKFGYLGILFCVLAVPRLGTAATCTWTGGGGDNNWSTAGNWDNCGGAHAIPQNGDQLIFPAGANRPTPVNDFPALIASRVDVTGLPAAGFSYTFTGNGITVTDRLVFTTPNDPTQTGPAFNVPIRAGAGPLLVSNDSINAGSPTVASIDTNGVLVSLNAFSGNLTVGLISGNGVIQKNGTYILTLTGANTFSAPMVVMGGTVRIRNANALGDAAAGTTLGANTTLAIDSGITLAEPLTLNGGQVMVETGNVTLSGPIAVTANSNVLMNAASVVVTMSGALSGSGSLIDFGFGTLILTGASPTFNGTVSTGAGSVIVDGALGSGTISNFSGTLSGSGTVGPVNTAFGTINPGHGGAGRLSTGALTLTNDSTVAIELAGPGAGSADQLKVTGSVTLANAALSPSLSYTPTTNSVFTIIDNDGTDPVVGTFKNLPEGAALTIGAVPFVISYVGGTGNDVTLSTKLVSTHYLSEGSTGAFFDTDILIANPNNVSATTSVDYLRNSTRTSTVVTVPPQSRETIHVDAVPGMEATAFATEVRSDTPIVVERSMFWDASYYAGSTGSAVEAPSADWVFAEGSQGFFSTYLLLLNSNSTSVNVAVTFLLEGSPPVVRNVTIDPFSRFTLDCATVPEIVNRSFGITVHADQKITAERSMYFGTTPTRLWSGGHESAGVSAPAKSWFLAEGATGGFFDTFVLLSNPQSTDAHVTVKFLLDNGDTVTETKVIGANQRLTINIEAEPDPRLANAAVSTVVTSDVAIVVERSMYWIGDPGPWTEAHNSFGVTDSGLHWGLAEGRVGGPHNFHTYILLANPDTSAAQVTVTFLRAGKDAITKTYTVPATSRYNIDVNAVDPAMHDEDVGADIQVTNAVPIVVERSMYWDQGGVLFKGGTNATGVRLP